MSDRRDMIRAAIKRATFEEIVDLVFDLTTKLGGRETHDRLLKQIEADEWETPPPHWKTLRGESIHSEQNSKVSGE